MNAPIGLPQFCEQKDYTRLAVTCMGSLRKSSFNCGSEEVCATIIGYHGLTCGGKVVPDALNEDLFFNLDRATLLMRRHVLDVIAYHQVSPEQWEILRLVDQQKGISQRELSMVTLKDKGNVSRILSRMLKNGWIRRTAHESGRGFVITLSTEGRKIRSHLPDIVDKQIGRILEPLAREERTELLYCLKKLRILLGDDDVIT